MSSSLLWRTRWRFEPRAALLVGFSLPFLLVWWWFFSYDLRFLLMVWALFGVMGARLLLDVYRRLPLPESGRKIVRWALPLALIAVTFPAARMAVDHKAELLSNPLMSDIERHRVQLGPRYDVVLWLRDNAPPEARILVTDYFLVYPVMQTHPDVTFRPWAMEDMADRDLWVLAPGVDLPNWADPARLELLADVNGYRVYEVSELEAPRPEGHVPVWLSGEGLG